MIKLLGRYKNGNYTVRIYEDGTKIRKTEANEFIPEFAENIDIKITNKCTGINCQWCHEGSGECGRHGNIMGERFIDTLKPWQEVALGGGNVLEHPSLVPFLRKLRQRNVIANITVNQIHFERDHDIIQTLIDEELICGLGLSLVDPTQEFINKVQQYPNAVIHVINGILTKEQCATMCNQDLKVLILGYKNLRRGTDYYKDKDSVILKNQNWLYDHLPQMLNEFELISFDNLAIEQLDAERLMSEEEWDEFYMGDDGNHTFYIDMVNRQFSRSSTAPFSKRYELLDDVAKMFEHIRKTNID